MNLIDRAVAAVLEKAKAQRIKGDGDGDGIPYEGRNKPAGNKLKAAAIRALLAQHGGMGMADEAMARQIVRAAARGDADRISRFGMQTDKGKAFKAAILSAIGGQSGAAAPKPAPTATPAAKPAARPAPSPKPSAARANSGDAHSATKLDMSPRETEAFQNYTGAMFRDINPRLRAGKSVAREDKQDVAVMDAAFQRAKTTSDITVYRGVGGDFINKLTKGVSFTDGGFVSTTSSQSMADGFARGDQEAVMEIRVPKGSKAISVTDISQFSKTEKEIVLNRGAKFRVIDRIEGVGRKPTRIVMEYIG